MKETKWNSLADGNWPVSNKKVLLNTTKYGTVLGYYDIEDNAFFILSGAKPQILHINEVIAWTDIPKCNIEKPTTNFRLPTKAEFERLSKCFTRFSENPKGYVFLDEETKQKLFLPCTGIRDNGNDLIIGMDGQYWSDSYGYNLQYYFSVYSNTIQSSYSRLNRSYNVRLVSDEHFEGAIHVAGLYWKQENEKGFYTWDEAMSKFNNKN